MRFHFGFHIDVDLLLDMLVKASILNPLVFRNGSIIVEYAIFFRGPVNEATAIGPLKEAIKNGNLGSFNVVPSSFLLATTASPSYSSPSPSFPGGMCNLQIFNDQAAWTCGYSKILLNILLVYSPVKPEGNNCWSGTIVIGLSALIVVQFVIISLLIGYICWLRRRGASLFLPRHPPIVGCRGNICGLYVAMCLPSYSHFFIGSIPLVK